MTNRERLALETKKKIIVSARKLIKEKGIRNISISDITNDAGVAKGSFYTYFEKKEDVLSAIAYQNFNVIKDKWMSSDSDDAVFGYLDEFVSLIYDGGLELCKSWTSNEVVGKNSEICKYDMDSGNFANLLETKGISNALLKSKRINSYLYGIMSIWCMTNGKVDFKEEYKNSKKLINKILEE